MRKKFIPSLAFISAIIITPSSYVQAQEKKDTDNNGLPVISTGKASNTTWGESTIEINSIEKSKNGSYTTLTWTVRNKGNTDISAADFWHGTYNYRDDGVAGVKLIDDENEVSYNTAHDSNGTCLCAAKNQHPKLAFLLEPGMSATYWNSYLLSEETSEVTVDVPGFLPVTGVPVE